MFACPCCGKPGVGFFGKLLSNPGYPAICRYCRAEVSKTAGVLKLQLVLGLIGAVVAGFLPGTGPALAMAGVIVLVGLCGPTRGIPP